MTRNRGRPQKNTTSVHIHLSTLLIAEIKTKHPTLLKPGTTEFRHGALASWIENVLWKELRSGNTHVQSQIIGRGQPRQSVGPSEPRPDIGRSTPGEKLPTGGAKLSGDVDAGGELGSLESSDRAVKREDRSDYGSTPDAGEDIYERE